MALPEKQNERNYESHPQAGVHRFLKRLLLNRLLGNTSKQRASLKWIRTRRCAVLISLGIAKLISS
jgi:hypothetical protein